MPETVLVVVSYVRVVLSESMTHSQNFKLHYVLAETYRYSEMQNLRPTQWPTMTPAFNNRI